MVSQEGCSGEDLQDKVKSLGQLEFSTCWSLDDHMRWVVR